jgi:hypothetical protein
MRKPDNLGFDFAGEVWRLGDNGLTVFGPATADPAPVTICTLPGPSPRVSEAERRTQARLIVNAPKGYHAAELAAAVLDSFVNGQGAVTPQEVDAAHEAICQYLNAANGISP